MKPTKIFFIFSIIGGLSLLLSGCKSEEFDGLNPTLTPHTLSVSRKDFKFSSPGAHSETFSVESVQTPWKFLDCPDWIKLSPSSGSSSATVSMSVSANLETNSRTALFFLSTTSADWKYEISMTATQSGAEPYLSVMTTYLSFGGKASSQTVAVSSNFDWKASSQQNWISLQKSEDGSNLTVLVTENPEFQNRNGVITLNNGSSTYATINVEQFPADVSSSDMTLNFKSSASKYDITISSENEWNATTSDSWIQISPVSGGVGDTKVMVEVTRNDADDDRRGYITIYTGNAERLQIQVIQMGIHMEVVSNYTFTAAGGTHVFDYTSDRPWFARIEGDSSWLTLSSSSGSGEEEITITASPNSTLQDRNATVIITPENYNEITINLTQSGKYLRSSVNSLSFFAKGGVSDPIIIETDSEFTMDKIGDWFTINTISDNVFTVTAEANPVSNIRNGSIKFTMQGLSEGSFVLEIPVTQTGEGGSFVTDGYPGDFDWNSASSGGITITVNGFSADQNWN